MKNSEKMVRLFPRLAQNCFQSMGLLGLVVVLKCRELVTCAKKLLQTFIAFLEPPEEGLSDRLIETKSQAKGFVVQSRFCRRQY